MALLIALSMGTAVVAHSAETVVCSEAVDGQHVSDGAQPLDETGSADPDNGSLHMHGSCHGHHLAQPLPDSGEPARLGRTAPPYDNYAPRLTAVDAQQGLRPPIA
jgi:hypothetical protein